MTSLLLIIIVLPPLLINELTTSIQMCSLSYAYRVKTNFGNAHLELSAA